MDLVIVESPTKIKKIGKFLGKDFTVLSSVGHIRDLPKSELGVEIDKKYEPVYVESKDKKQVIKDLKTAAKEAKQIYLATDPDREGEAIAFHIAHILGYKRTTKKTDNLHRVSFNEITKDAVLEAFKTPREVDLNLVDAQQARRVLDRLVGYKLSPLIWKKIMYGLSAGRVQSVAVRLIVEREIEREKFDQKPYFVVTAELEKTKKESFSSLLYKINEDRVEVKQKFELFAGDYSASSTVIDSKEKSDKILADIKGKEFEVVDVNKSEAKRQPNAPFTTSTMQQEASWRINFAPRKTMSVAQKLYENGHITYMRTDSTNLSATAVTQIRKFVKDEFGNKYLSQKDRVFAKKSKVAQEAHEAIRPTDVNKKAEDLNLTPEQVRLYEMIWQRTVATQMASAIYDKTRVDFKVTGKDEYIFRTSGSIIKFDGYLKVYPGGNKDEELPAISVSDKLKATDILSDEKQMTPPPRYNQASLIKELENFDIGRPSTYASIIDTIEKRRYVVNENKQLIPTDMGIVVTNLIKDHFNEIVDLKFTAKMENDLDEIANGTGKYFEMINDFYKPFEKKIERAEKNIKRDDYKVLGKAPSTTKCPVCKKGMIIKLGKNGKFYSCKDFPECEGIRDMDGSTEADYAKKVNNKEFKDMYLSAPKTDDGRDFVLKRGRYGEFFAHPDYPKVKETAQLEFTPEYLEKEYGKAPKAKDGSKMVFKKGRFGPYWAHINYPEVKETVRIKVAKKEEEN